MRELIKKLRKYEIQIRKAINTQLQGDFKSVFKGSGLEYDDVRQYQYGDDVRTIDWRVSAKGHGTFVKTYVEDKEQIVYFIIDVSGSQDIGSRDQTKLEICKEITGVLAMAASREASKVGLIAFSDRKELYFKPLRGQNHIYQLIKSLFSLQPKSSQTDLDGAFKYTLNHLKKKSVVFLISDFIDENYQHTLKGLARKHDVIAVHVSDKRERKMPKLGIVPVHDKETGKTKWINSSSSFFRTHIAKRFERQSEELQDFSNKHQINYVHIDTKENYVPKLIQLFNIRNQTFKRG
ncbi:DUF58 domain-containing protein [Mangrovivirga sp. M17]|uniref:DUF58 domain-containing protein n=1 Tax=Mangrovivirga halotolerans TaxID=2993936 RepID=A0ABT3RN73_9BACT|nr:DUF58 domain-containing protein [Mangrovivirga halotolerans]MCX2742824.1 DUF58 domain-containing protein [Mangrovivirga halotolerans]